jgi:RimJ/RimL family protein N-acetyltransferase
MTPPILTTQRLRLRPFRMTDFDGFAALHAAPHAAWMWAISARDDAWRMMLALAGEWQVRGFGMWAIADRVSDAFLGHAGFLQPHDADEPELGWAVTAPAEGKGIAREAVVAARSQGAATLGIERPVSNIDARNLRSIRLAERLGARLERRIAFGPEAVCLVYRHPAAGGAA